MKHPNLQNPISFQLILFNYYFPLHDLPILLHLSHHALKAPASYAPRAPPPCKTSALCGHDFFPDLTACVSIGIYTYIHAINRVACRHIIISNIQRKHPCGSGHFLKDAGDILLRINRVFLA